MRLWKVRALQIVVVAGLLLLLASCGRPAMPLLEGTGGLPTLAPLLDRVTPAVVNISVRSRYLTEVDPLYREPFFGGFSDSPWFQSAPVDLSVGSGVIVDATKGYVITDHHVVANGKEIIVTLKDRRRFDARLVGGDPGTDIALLRIAADNLTELPFGNSDALRVGDFVVAVGNPFGLGQTVTSGIVSALDRTGLNLEGYEDFIQTDAPINPGNSGGALITLTGELIGINTAIIAPGGGNVGIGFAVPSNMAQAVTVQLLEFGEVRRGRLGLAIEDLTPGLAAVLEIEGIHGGAVVRDVEAGSSAEKADIKVGDVVIEFNGTRLRDSSNLRNRVGLVPVGEIVELTLLRDGKTETVRIRLRGTEAVSAGGV